ncbi:MAG: hydantoinase B/oxoprolinase family protein [Chloroflexota bacterium]
MTDELSLTVIWGRLVAIAEQMGRVVQRTAYSESIREGRDFSIGLFSADGQLLAQADLSPGHLGAMPHVVQNCLAEYPPETLKEGDVVVLNDSFLGSGHLPDFFCLSPVTLGDRKIGYVVSSAHLLDVGGPRPGSQAIEGVDNMYSEGLRLPPVRLFDSGLLNNELARVIAANSRVPAKVLGDLASMRGALHVGAQHFRELRTRYGLKTTEAVFNAILDRSEEAVRSELDRLPRGRFRFVDFLDDVGARTPPVRMEVEVTIADREITYDFSGSDPQTPSAINSPLSFTRAFCYWATKAITVGNALPQNSGQLRPIRVHAPQGSFFNPQPPAASGGRALLNQRIVELIFGALAAAIPERVTAASGQWSNPTLGGIDPRTGQAFVFYDYTVGGVGARLTSDGVNALSPVFSLQNIPVEVQEANYPLRIERLELMTDSGGPGEHRGGLSVRKDLRILADDVELSCLTDRAKYAAFGVMGGKFGTASKIVLNPGRGERRLHSKGSYRLKAGDVVSFRGSGSGGFGSPRRRSRQSVEDDLREGYVSRAAARAVYGLDV